MGKNISSIFVALGIVVVVAFSSCKKDSPNPGAPGVNTNGSGNPAVNAVPLNGGSVLGRWSSELYHTEDFLNNTLQATQTDSVQVGEEVIEFMSGGTFNLYLDTMLLDWGTYTTSSNHLHLSLDSGDEADFTYGTTTTQMRWNTVESFTDTLGTHTSVSNILFVRY